VGSLYLTHLLVSLGICISLQGYVFFILFLTSAHLPSRLLQFLMSLFLFLIILLHYISCRALFPSLDVVVSLGNVISVFISMMFCTYSKIFQKYFITFYSGEDAYKKIRSGATLVQLYTALAYGGPALIPRIKVISQT
jgi:hypothetical protein